MKKIYLELLRIIAIVMVLFNHTNEKGFYLFPYTDNVLEYVVSLWLSVICKMGVPIFFMISGSLLLSKVESIKMTFRRIYKYALIMVISVGFTTVILNGMGGGIRLLLKSLWRGDIGTYWYLYAYMSLLLMLPFLRAAAQKMKREEYFYLLGLQLLFVAILPTIVFWGLDYFMGSGLVLSLISDSIFYFLMGYFVDGFLAGRYNKKKSLWIDCILSLVMIGAACIMTIYQGKFLGGYSESFLGMYLAIPTMTLFGVVKYFGGKIEWSKWSEKAINALGAAVLMVYLSEPVVQKVCSKLFIMIYSNMESILASFVVVLVKLMIGVVLGLLIRYVFMVIKSAELYFRKQNNSDI